MTFHYNTEVQTWGKMNNPASQAPLTYHLDKLNDKNIQLALDELFPWREPMAQGVHMTL